MIDELRQEQIQLEETVPGRERTPDASDEERAFRLGIRRDVRRMRKAGIEASVPARLPDLAG